MHNLTLKKPPRRVIIVSTPGFGDLLLVTPLIRSLKRAWPDVKIDVMMHRGREAVLEGNPDVDRCLPIPKRMNPFAYLGWLARLVGRYDLSFAPNGGDRRIVMMRVAARRTLPMLKSTGTSTWWHKLFATVPVYRDQSVHTTQEVLQLSDVLGVERVDGVVAPHSPTAETTLDKVVPFDWRTTPYAVMHVTTHATRKRWSVEGWTAVARKLEARGWRCVLTGGPLDEGAYIDEVLASIGESAVDLRGRFTMSEIRALIEASRVYVGVDTSTAHIAGAVGTPTLVVFGPGTPTQFAPWPKGYSSRTAPFDESAGISRTDNVCVVRGECPCGRDYRKGCGITMPGRARCLDELSIDTVLQALDELLDAH